MTLAVATVVTVTPSVLSEASISTTVSSLVAVATVASLVTILVTNIASAATDLQQTLGIECRRVKTCYN